MCSATDLCQSVGRLTLGSGGLSLANSWTLGKVAGTDLDLTTALVLGGGLGFASGKDGFVHVLNPANLKLLQDLQVSTVINGSGTGGHVHGGPVFWDGPSGALLYVWPEANPLQVFRVTAGGLGTTPISQYTGRQPSHPGPITALSSNGKTAGTGILWATMATMDGVDTWHGIFPGTLYAFNAEDVSKAIWNSDQNAGDTLGMFAKFCPPTVANGKVYVGTATSTNALRVYGLH
jgi:outer membrane protein assembly factor BamB